MNTSRQPRMKQNAGHHLSKSLSQPKRAKALFAALLLTTACLAEAQTPLPDDSNPGANGNPFAFAVQPDGKILVGGQFTTLGGAGRTNLARLNANGTLDTGFNPPVSGPGFLGPFPGGFSGIGVASMALQVDGKILVGGTFSSVAGQPRTNLARLNPDGTLDSTFVFAVTGEWRPCVYALAIQADGKTLVGGLFTELGGQPRTNLARLNPEGTLDNTFNPGLFDVYDSAHALAVQADGKILVGSGAMNLYRLNPDGSLDGGFNPGTNGEVMVLAVQADGKILMGARFIAVDGLPHNRLVRLNSDGTVDSGFNSGTDDRIASLALQADGKILVSGACAALEGPTCRYVWRHLPDGTLDNTFNPAAVGAGYPWISALGLQPDGKILLGGWFTSLGGQPRTNIARLNNTDPPTQSITYDGSAIIWLRGGASPEVWRTSLEITTNGSDWTKLGTGSRSPGGWRFTGVSLPSAATLRLRGQVAGGHYNGSGWFVESYYGRPLVVVPPASRTNDAGSTATFSVKALGDEPFSFRWLKEGVLLADGGNVLGAETAVLTLTNVLGSDDGRYSVVISTASGSVTSQVARLTVIDPLITADPASQNRELGQTATFSVTTAGTAPFLFQWRKDGVALPRATNAALTLTNLTRSDAGQYTVVISNAVGSITSSVALLTVNAITVDGAFNAGAGDNAVYPVAAQANGKILVGGSFYSIGGAARSSIARLNADGLADSGFNPGAGTFVYSLAAQEDGKLLVGGSFNYLGGMTRNYLGRLNADGTLDSGFNPGAGSWVFSLAVQEDGKILVGGAFTTLSGTPRNYLGRLNPDGTLDNGFNPGASYIVSSLVVQPDGKILAGGYFTMLGGQPRTNLARLNPNGTLDLSFNPGAMSDDWSSRVSALALQADGKILVGGTFSTLGGQPHANLARLNPDGTLDVGFNPGAVHDSTWETPSVSSLSVQMDGKILVTGDFTRLCGQPRNRLGRLNPDGSLDLSFNPGNGGDIAHINSTALQADGKILVGGQFNLLGGQARTNVARLNNTEPATENLSRGASMITWLRGGSGPEVWRTVFDHSSNGISWTSVGPGTRIPGGWQWNGASLPAGGTLRARGVVAAGYQDASSWFVETLIGSPVFLTQPSNQTANAGSTVTFTVQADGPGPIGYQWLKNGLTLADGAGVGGTASSTLSLTNVLKAAEGDYRLVVTNTSGSVTSLVATLTVVDPVILVSPLSRYAEPGQSATFTLTAVGTALNYQWWKDGVALPQGTEVSLTLTNLQLTDAGGYLVVVSNQFGSLTSGVATLTVNLATLDTGFNPGAGGTVSALALQTDGKVVFGGLFTTLAGQTRVRIGRLNTNGTLDTSFSPQANATVYSLALQPDGKILVGGDFTSLAGSSRRAVGRLNTNGSLDTGFTTTVFTPPQGSTITARVQAILVQPDGKIVIGGRSALNSGPTSGFISRLNTNGATDTSFITTSGVNGPVSALAFQADGKILAGGLFTSLRGQLRNRLGRLNGDGSLDTAFNPGVDSTVLTLAVQADGKILVGGAFNTVASQQRPSLARLNPDGTLDTSFAPAVTGGSASVYSLALQTDGRMLLSGLFTSVAGHARANCARLNADGTLDTGFNLQPNNLVYGLAVQADGRIMAVGDFTQLAGQSRNRIARLNPTEPATESLDYDGSTLTWQRGGASPEVGRTSFEFSTNLSNWTALGDGTRIAAGWELGGLVSLPGGRIRARGFVAGGGFNASGWFVEKTLDAGLISRPLILTSDGNFGFRTNQFGFNLQALPGQAVVVEASTNLITWNPIHTNLMGGLGLFLFLDLESGIFPRRFYRARLHNGGLPPPAIRSGDMLGFQNGHFGFDITAVAGQTVLIESSTNLLSWQSLQTNTLDTGLLYFSDPASSNAPSRFYRARLLP